VIFQDVLRSTKQTKIRSVLRTDAFPECAEKVLDKEVLALNLGTWLLETDLSVV